MKAPWKALTNLPPEVAKAIRNKAKKELRSAYLRGGKPTVHLDLDHLFGIWTRNEADEFDFVLQESRSVIDPRDWE